jgi:class 3 adenylate cyclase
VEKWLSSIGLTERVAAFRAQGISSDQLDELTDDDLRELGLTIGERKRFRHAVAALRPSAPDDLPPSALPLLETTRAERRPLTIMFVDMVDSSYLGERLEPEDLLEVIRRYREFCGAAITRYGGHIARLVGDGILAYFCYPVANENDPERAVRAALDITRRIGELITPAGKPLNVRIGIATGRVIVSDLFAGGEDRRSIIGSTPNLAARLQGFAPSGGIAIANETHERIAALFTCVDLGELVIRGMEQRHRVWRVLGEAATTRADFGRRSRRLTAFHDRIDESRLLAQHWRGACEGHGNTVVVTGEAELLAGDPGGNGKGVGPTPVPMRLHRFAELRVGPETTRDPILWVASAHVVPIVDMLLGADWLGSRRVWLSFATKQMFVSQR